MRQPARGWLEASPGARRLWPQLRRRGPCAPLQAFTRTTFNGPYGFARTGVGVRTTRRSAQPRPSPAHHLHEITRLCSQVDHTVATFWSTQLGVRADGGEGPHRQWAAFGIQGLAPYWFELEATGYVGPSGRTAARFRAEYELLFTQRLILQPEFEANAYGSSDRARRLGSGLSDTSLGLRLRYEFHRQFAPYVGVVWTRRWGGTADFARNAGQGRFNRQWVAGVRIWF